MDDRLIPYSVHLRRDIYDKLKEAAGDRKASALVRDAITMIIEGENQVIGGYRKGVREAIETVHKNKLAMNIAYEGEPIGEILIDQLNMLISEAPRGKTKA